MKKTYFKYLFSSFKNDLTRILAIFLIVFLGVGFYRLAKAKDSQNQKMQYKVIVDDTVKAKDFLEKYTIIEVDGKIYTVEDRVDD